MSATTEIEVVQFKFRWNDAKTGQTGSYRVGIKDDDADVPYVELSDDAYERACAFVHEKLGHNDFDCWSI